MLLMNNLLASAVCYHLGFMHFILSIKGRAGSEPSSPGLHNHTSLHFWLMGKLILIANFSFHNSTGDDVFVLALLVIKMQILRLQNVKCSW